MRTYSVAETLAVVPQLAEGHGLNVTLGARLDNRLESNDEEIERLVEVYRETPRNVVRVIVGNETPEGVGGRTVLRRQLAAWASALSVLTRHRTRTPESAVAKNAESPDCGSRVVRGAPRAGAIWTCSP